MNDVNLHPHGGLAELVDCTGLENRRTARYRGFESLSLRTEYKSARTMRALSFSSVFSIAVITLFPFVFRPIRPNRHRVAIHPLLALTFFPKGPLPQ